LQWSNNRVDGRDFGIQRCDFRIILVFYRFIVLLRVSVAEFIFATSSSVLSFCFRGVQHVFRGFDFGVDGVVFAVGFDGVEPGLAFSRFLWAFFIWSSNPDSSFPALPSFAEIESSSSFAFSMNPFQFFYRGGSCSFASSCSWIRRSMSCSFTSIPDL